MEIEIARALVEAGQELGREITLRESYSGRGMYGESTAAVVYGRTGSLLASVAVAAVRIREEEELEPEEGVVELCVEEFVSSMEHLNFDNMGHGYVAY